MNFLSKLFRRKPKLQDDEYPRNIDNLLSIVRYNLNSLIRIQENCSYALMGEEGSIVKKHWNKICDTINSSYLREISPIFKSKRRDIILDVIYCHEIKGLISTTTDFLHHVVSDESNLEDIFLWDLIHPELQKFGH